MVKNLFGKLRPFFARLFVVYMPASFIQWVGDTFAALKYFRAVRRLPAYRQLVLEHLGTVPTIVRAKNFHKLPVLDKKSYLNAHRLDDLLAGKINAAYCIQKSSGFSGVPTYWFKTPREARESNLTFQVAWQQYFNPRNESILAIIGFSLGTWTSGTDLLRLVTDMAVYKGHKITAISPGEDVAETLEIIADFAGHFAKTIVFGNPVYLKRLVDEGSAIDWPSLNIMFSTGGEATTEAWREYLAKRLAVDIDQEPMRIVNAYGAADFGAAAATETPLSIRIKRLASKDPKLAAAIFDRQGNLPNLFQYNPLDHHIEQHGANFLVSYWSHIPLVRYNIRDRGRVFSYNEMKRILRECGYDLRQLCANDSKRPFKIPFLYVDSRDDGTVAIGGANVYPGNIETAIIEHAELRAVVEHFYLTVAPDAKGDSYLTVQLLIPGLDKKTPEWQKALKKKAFKAIHATLLRDNREYKVTWQHNRHVSPRIELLKAERARTQSLKRKHIKEPLESVE